MKIKTEGESIVAALRAYANEYSTTDGGLWLRDFDWASIPVELKRFADPDVCGQYTFGVILLMECAVPSALFEIYVHELRHAWQSRKCLWKYLLGKIFRPLIEKRAYEEQDKAAAWIESRPDLVSAYESV